MGLINHKAPSIPKQEMHEYIWLLAGRNKVGKTTLASNFPKPYFFTFEPGTSALLTYETNVIKTANDKDRHPWAVYKDAIKEFVANDGYGFKTVVTDPYGEAYQQCEDYICQKLNIEHPSDLEWGKGWAEVKKEFKTVTNQLVSHNYTILFVTHIDVKNQKDGLGDEKDKVDLDISGKSGKFIRNMADIFLLAEFDKNGDRKLFVRPTTNKEAGSRLDFGEEVINMDFNELKKSFNQAVKENNKKQGVTEEMIQQHYQDKQKEKEKQKKLSQIRKDIIDLLKYKGIPPAKNEPMMKKEIGISKVKRINDVEKGKKYIKYLQELE